MIYSSSQHRHCGSKLCARISSCIQIQKQQILLVVDSTRNGLKNGSTKIFCLIRHHFGVWAPAILQDVQVLPKSPCPRRASPVIGCVWLCTTQILALEDAILVCLSSIDPVSFIMSFPFCSSRKRKLGICNLRILALASNNTWTKRNSRRRKTNMYTVYCILYTYNQYRSVLWSWKS